VVKESRDPVSRGFDPAGQGLFIVGVGALTFALIQGSQFGWTSEVILTSFALALLGLGVFVWWERRGSNPMMDVRLFGNRVYSAAVYSLFAVLFCGYGTLLVVTQFFQNVEGYTPIEAGILMLAFSLPYMVSAPLAGRLVMARGPRSPTLLGVGLVALGVGTFAASSTSVLPVTLLALFVIGAGNGVGVSAATAVAMVDIPGDRAGMASGMLSAQRALGSTAGFAIMGSVLATVVALVLPVRLEPVIPDPATRDQVVSEVVAEANPQAVTAVIAPSAELPLRVRQSDAALAAAESAFVAGIRAAMLVGFVVIASAFIIGWRVFPRRPRARAPAPSR
jgi:hypothetical protein